MKEKNLFKDKEKVVVDIMMVLYDEEEFSNLPIEVVKELASEL